ncbi:MAG: ATP-binding protein [Croceibacterium sp.]
MRQYDARHRLDEIRDARERMSIALAAGRLGAWTLDLRSNHLEASIDCKAHFGRSEVQSFTYEELLASNHPEDSDRMRQAVAHAVNTGARYDIEYRTIWSDGSLHWVQINGQLESDDAGQPLRMVGVSHDITSRHDSESRRAALLTLGDALRQANDRGEMTYLAAEILGTTVGVSRAGYACIDPAAETLAVEGQWHAPGIPALPGILNVRDYRSYLEVLKRHETLVVADARTDARTRDDAPALEDPYARAFMYVPLVDQEEVVGLVYLHHREVRNWPAEEREFVGEVVDRTQGAIERRKAEISLEEFTGSLEKQVAERTREIEAAQEQLRQAQKMEAVGQLTGGLAHDFNNLLTGISGSLELIEVRIKQGRSGEIDKYLDMARSASKRAAALTHRLLAFSRRQTLDPKPSDINRIIANLEEFLRRSVGPQVEIEVVGAGGLWTTLIDPNQLENALLNLCINARDAMPDGGRITIETANKWLDERAAKVRDLAVGQYVSLCVSDTGTGMSPETIQRAFDPFYTTKPLGEGTGLGLSMIYGFVRQSGGQVRIYSEVGQGTTMCLYFPRVNSLEGPDPEPEERLAEASTAAGETVLVVDDEPAIRALVTDVLAELGYNTLEAGDGPAGLAILKSQPNIALLVTDVGLPKGMNGRQFADAARVERPDLKVLFITGYAENAVIGSGRLDPGMHVLTKPFAMDTFAKRIQALISE